MKRSTATAIVLALILAAPAYGTKTVYTSNSGSLGGIESITPFSVNADGSLVPNPVVSVGDRPEGVTVTPDARFLYVATSQSAGVRGYAIGPDGSLTEVPGSPFETLGMNTTGIAVTPDGDRVLATNRGSGLNNQPPPGSVAVYDIDQETGALSSVAGSPFAVTGLEDPTGIAVAPDGGRVYVAGDAAGATFDGRVAVFDIDEDTGLLSQVPGSPFSSGAKQSFPLLVSHEGRLLFVGNLFGTGSISELEIDQTSGALAPIAGSPFPTAGTAPRHLALTPNGRWLLSAERPPEKGVNNGVSVYGFAGNGGLSTVEGSPFSTGAGEVYGVATAPDGLSAYAMLGTNPGSAAGFSIGATGALAPLGQSPFPTGDRFAGYFSIAMTPSQTPRPAFTAPKTGLGQATGFDASQTTVPGGRATRFDWDFGDGTKLPDGGPRPSHTYGALGTYMVSLTVTNDCAADARFTGDTVFTGQTAHCRGNPQGTVSQAVDVVDATAPVLSGVTITKRFAPGPKATRVGASASRRRIRQGGRIAYRLSEKARVRIAIQKKGGSTARASKGKFILKGALIRNGRRGRNSVPFSGRIGGRPLTPGRYRMVVRATDQAGNRSKPKRKAFSIVRAPS